MIGRALAASLAADGQEVIILSRSPEGVTKLPPGVRVERWDGCNSGAWADLIGDAAIVNLAGENLSGRLWTQRRKQAMLCSRLDPGEALTETILASSERPRVVIQASASGYYGPHEDEEISEDTKAGRDYLSNMATLWEDSTRRVESVGVRRAIIRSGIVLSREGVTLPLLALPVRMFVGGPLGSGRQWLPWIHVHDEVRAIRFLIDDETAGGPFNLCSPQTLRFREFGQTLARVLGRPYWLPIPGPALRLALGEMSIVVLKGQRTMPCRLLERGFTFRYPDAETALRNLYHRERA